MADETDDKFMNLDEAAAFLAEKGLTGQSVAVLRSAIAGRRLAALKDGIRWKTSRKALDDYVALLWNLNGDATPFPGNLPRTGVPGQPGRKAVDLQEAIAANQRTT